MCVDFHRLSLLLNLDDLKQFLFQVSVRGPQEDVNKAKKMLLELANEKQETSFTAEVRAKPKHHRFLIGRNGTNIKKVRDETGARVVFPTDKDTDKELIVIIGRKDAVAKAKEQLEKMIKELVSVA